MNMNTTCNRVKTPFGDFQIDMDNLMDHFFGETQRGTTSWSPRISVAESDSEYRMVIELSGVDPENVSIEMKEGRLEISGEKKVAELPEGFNLIRDERVAGEFKRTFEFSTLVDADRIEANITSGLLHLVLPKSEKVLPRKIEIKSDGN